MRKLIALMLVVLMIAALCVCVFADTDPVYSPTATTSHETGSSEASGPQTGFSSTPIVIAFAVLVVAAVAAVFVIRPIVKKEH